MSASLVLLALAAVAVTYALAVSALVVAVNKGLGFSAAALRTGWTRSFHCSVEPWFKNFHHLPHSYYGAVGQIGSAGSAVLAGRSRSCWR